MENKFDRLKFINDILQDRYSKDELTQAIERLKKENLLDNSSCFTYNKRLTDASEKGFTRIRYYSINSFNEDLILYAYDCKERFKKKEKKKDLLFSIAPLTIVGVLVLAAFVVSLALS